MSINEDQANKERRARVVAEHRRILKREADSKTRETVRKKIEDEMRAHWEREKEMLAKLSPEDRRKHYRKVIARILGAGAWLGVVVFGPTACEQLLLSTVPEPQKEVLDKVTAQEERIEGYRQEGEEYTNYDSHNYAPADGSSEDEELGPATVTTEIRDGRIVVVVTAEPPRENE